MNGHEQRQRHTAIQSVEQSIENIFTILQAFDARQVELGAATKAALELLDDRITRSVGQLQDEAIERGLDQQRVLDRLTERVEALDRHRTQLQQRTGWQRLRELVIGR